MSEEGERAVLGWRVLVMLHDQQHAFPNTFSPAFRYNTLRMAWWSTSTSAFRHTSTCKTPDPRKEDTHPTFAMPLGEGKKSSQQALRTRSSRPKSFSKVH